MSEKIPLWFRQDGETDRQFEMFQTFISLPLSVRGAGHIAEKFGVSNDYVRRVRSEKNWNERAAAFDNHLAAIRIEAAGRAAAQMSFDWEEWERANLEQTREITDKLFAKANAILSDDKIKYSGSDVSRFLEAGVILTQYLTTRAKALAVANPINRILPVPPKPLEDLDSWTDEELKEYAEECRRASQKVARGEPLDDEFIN